MLCHVVILREVVLKKMESNFCRVGGKCFQKCPPLDKTKPLFNGVFQPRSETLPNLQYNDRFMWKTDYTDFVIVNRRQPS